MCSTERSVRSDAQRKASTAAPARFQYDYKTGSVGVRSAVPLVFEHVHRPIPVRRFVMLEHLLQIHLDQKAAAQARRVDLQ